MLIGSCILHRGKGIRSSTRTRECHVPHTALELGVPGGSCWTIKAGGDGMLLRREQRPAVVA